MNQKITVRPSQVKDAERIYQFICELENARFDPAVFEVLYLKNLQDDDCIYLCAVAEDKEVVGFISAQGQVLLHHCRNVFEIQELFVATHYRRSRVGKLLIRELEQLLLARGCATLEVTTNKKRTDAIRFYLKEGFEQTHLKYVKQLDV